MDNHRLLPLGLVRWLPLFLLGLLIVMFGVISFSASKPIPPLMVGWAFAYYWLMFQPARMPFVGLLLAGIMQDVVYAFPLGSSSLCFVMLAVGAAELRRIMSARHFLATWTGFGVASVAMAVLMSIAFTYVGRGDVLDLALQWFYSAGLSWLIYPPLHWLCNQMYAHIPHLQQRPSSL